MSVSRKGVTFTESDGEGAKGKRVTIPVGPAPNAIQMGSKPDGSLRAQEDFEAQPIRTGIDEQFPTDALTHEDPRDALMEMKQGLQTAGKPGVTPLGVMQAKDSDFEYLLEKEMLGLEADFQQWFAAYFDKASPEEKAWAREAFPRFYQQRLALLEKDIQQTKRLAELNLMGIRSEEDLYLTFAKEKGFINTDRLDNLMHPEAAAAAQSKNNRDAKYVRGLLSARARPRGDWGLNSRAFNAQQATNKKADAFPFKAYESGTFAGGEQKPFTAIPNMSSQTERKMQTKALLNNLF